MSSRSLLCIVALALSVCAPVWSQEARGIIRGRVTDPQDAVIPGATVQVTGVATGLTSNLKTNEQGIYQALYLPLGQYRITAESAGFKRVVRDNIEVRVNDRLEVNLVLQVGEVTETVTVSAETPLLETTSASTGQVVDARRVADLPIAHGEPYALMATTAGAAFTGDPGLDRPFEPSHIANYSMGGARGLRNELSLDGAPAGASTANPREVSASFVPPTDILAEMKIQTTSIDASVGQTEGGSVSLSLKSGTNDLHGTVYFNKLAPQLNANLFFANRAGQPVVEFDYNRWGVSATGPVLIPKLYNGKNRTFYMYGYEGIVETRPRGSVLTVPTDEQKTGNLSGLLKIGANYQVYDPLTRRAEGSRFRTDPVAGNIIPASRISPIATNILKYYAPPNVAGTADGGNNLSQPNLPEQANYYSHTWRLDHNFADRWRTFGRVSWYNRNSTYSDHFHNISTGEWFGFHSLNAAFDHVYTISPSAVVNLRYGYNRFIREQNRNPLGQGFDLTSLGFPKSWNDAIPADIRRFPNINLGGYYATNGTVSWRPQDTHQYSLSFDKILGAHSMKFGSDYRIYYKNQVNPDIASTGQIAFSDNYTRGPLDNSPAAPRGGGLASLLFGIPTGGSVERRAYFAEKNTMWAFFFQDDWKLSRKLSLTLGLRYETESPLEERYNRTVRGFDAGAPLPIAAAAQAAYARNPTPEIPASQFRVAGGLTFAGVGGQPRGVWNRDNNNFMPRIGLVYHATPKTVVRASYGVFYAFMGVRRGDVIMSGFSNTTNLVPTLDGVKYIATIANPFPDGISEPVGAALGAATFLGQGISFFEPGVKTPYNQRWQLGIQRQLPARAVLEINYTGSRGTALEVSREFNSIPTQYLSTSPVRDNDRNSYLTANLPNPFAGLLPGTGRTGATISRQTLFTPYPQFTSVGTTTNQGYSTYHSLAIELDRRFSKGFTIQGGYTWSKFMEATAYLNGADPLPAYTISDQDFPHRLSMSFIYELPFGKGRAVLGSAPRAVNALAGGWQVQGIHARQSGPSLGFGNMLFYGDIKKIALDKGQRTIDRWFDTSMFERGNTRALVSNVRVAPLRFAGIRGPGPVNWDLSVLKNTHLNERINVQIRGEFLNATNTPFFGGPNTDQYSTAFGTITATRGYARRIQLGIKLIY
ncbi:MAG: TonB-dependent receptor [Acidobacteria bacterium]|nr:TonB-dependent receptor [Acidobacteriota bacterium]